jgi:hypothetical protein
MTDDVGVVDRPLEVVPLALLGFPIEFGFLLSHCCIRAPAIEVPGVPCGTLADVLPSHGSTLTVPSDAEPALGAVIVLGGEHTAAVSQVIRGGRWATEPYGGRRRW